MDIKEKLGITPIEERFCEDTGSHDNWCAAHEVRKLERQRSDMLNGLLELIEQIEFDYYLYDSKEEFNNLVAVQAVESVTGKAWKEIKELINEGN